MILQHLHLLNNMHLSPEPTNKTLHATLILYPLPDELRQRAPCLVGACVLVCEHPLATNLVPGLYHHSARARIYLVGEESVPR